MTKIFEQLLKQRGLDEDFLHPNYDELFDPFAMQDMQKAVDRIELAREKNEKVLIFGDYDADGVTASSVMRAALLDFGVLKIEVVLPDRFKDGFGLKMSAVPRILESDAGLVVTVDNGSMANEVCDELKKHGIDVIVTDHHEPSREKLPECIIVDPCFSDLTRTYLAGVAVAANVIVTLADKVGHSIDYARFTPPIAIGTISDCMPMTYENACYIKEGLSYMNKGNACRFLEDLSKDIGTTPVDVSFDIAPLINSASRMGDTRIGASGFFTDEEDKVNSIITKLNELNNARKKATNDAKEAVKSIQIESWERIASMYV